MRELTKTNLHPADLNQARKQKHNVGFNPPSDPLEGLWWGTSEVFRAEDCLPAQLWSHRLVDDQIYSTVVFHKWKHAKWAMPLLRLMKLCVIQWGQRIFHLFAIERNCLERSLQLISRSFHSQFYNKCNIQQWKLLSDTHALKTNACKIHRAAFQHK